MAALAAAWAADAPQRYRGLAAPWRIGRGAPELEPPVANGGKVDTACSGHRLDRRRGRRRPHGCFFGGLFGRRQRGETRRRRGRLRAGAAGPAGVLENGARGPPPLRVVGPHARGRRCSRRGRRVVEVVVEVAVEIVEIETLFFDVCRASLEEQIAEMNELSATTPPTLPTEAASPWAAPSGVVPAPTLAEQLELMERRSPSRGGGDDDNGEGGGGRGAGSLSNSGLNRTDVGAGVTVELCYRVAGHNRFGWGDYSRPVRDRVQQLGGLVVTIPDSEAWMLALEAGISSRHTVFGGTVFGGGGGGSTGGVATLPELHGIRRIPGGERLRLRRGLWRPRAAR